MPDLPLSSLPGLDIRALNGLLLDVHRAGCEVGFQHFQALMLEETQALIPFDSACWGETTTTPFALHQMHLFNCDASIRDTYQGLGVQDCFLASLRTQPGVTVNLADLMPRARLVRNLVYRKLCRPYRIECALGTLRVEAPSSLAEFLVLWRHDAKRPFSEAERLAMELLLPHLLQARRLARQRAVFGEGHKESTNWGVADAHGVLHEAAPDFLHSLRARWPQWTGGRLPEALSACLDTGQPYRAGAFRMDITRKTGLYHLQIRAPEPLDRLSTRERDIALRYARGQTHTTIALELAISPATVRNHLARCFRKLAVSNKAELVQRLLHASR